MTAPLPTPDDVAGMRERHEPQTHVKSVPVFDEFDRPWQRITECSCGATSWPCDAARLLALVDSQRSEREQVAARLVQVATYSEVHANMGLCPEGPLDRSRDPECRVCEWTTEAATGEGS